VVRRKVNKRDGRKKSCDARLIAQNSFNKDQRFFFSPDLRAAVVYDALGKKVRDKMAGSVNKVILVGNLGRDPEVRHTNDGNPIVNLSVATSESWRDRSSGERRERTEWHRVVIFNDKLGEIAQKFLQKGSKVYLEGQLQTRKWSDQQGVEKYTTEVVLNRFRGELTMLDSRSGSGDFGNNEQLTEERAPEISSATSDLDDEIPF